jgi:cytochrome c554/c'-like protein
MAAGGVRPDHGAALMRESLRHRQHLFRVAALFVTGLLLFVAVRALLVPPDFGLYGHYRAGALADIRKTALSFAGRNACADCHPDISEALAKGKHARIGCESCHGALARHAEDPEKLKPAKLEVPALCLSCHTANVAKPKKFPQIDPSDHGDGARCTSCHAAHHPGDAP